MTTFAVQPDELKTLSTNLGTVKDGLQGGHDLLRGVGDVGSGRVHDALRHFADNWDYSTGKIGDHVKNLADKLSTAGNAYGGLDQQTADMFDGASS